jgi:hypothetical protein
MDEKNASIRTMLLFPNLEYRYPTSLKFGADSEWLKKGHRLNRVDDLLQVLALVRAA